MIQIFIRFLVKSQNLQVYGHQHHRGHGGGRACARENVLGERWQGRTSCQHCFTCRCVFVFVFVIVCAFVFVFVFNVIVNCLGKWGQGRTSCQNCLSCMRGKFSWKINLFCRDYNSYSRQCVTVPKCQTIPIPILFSGTKYF